MADTKQATPDDKQNDIALFSAEHDFGNAKYFYAARTAIAELKRLLASRSGPDRATPERKETCMHGTPISVNCGNCEAGDTWPIPKAGPDRATQDEEDEHSAAAVAATAYQICGVLRAPTRIMDYFSAIAQSELWPANPLPFSPDEWKPDRGQQDAPDGWISCAERLPTKRGFYLVWPARGMKYAEVFYRNNYGDWVGPDAVYPKQTHWQPAPFEPLAKAAREGQDATQMLLRIRATLQSRAEGHNTGGDIEVMRAVDAIVRREAPKGKST